MDNEVAELTKEFRRREKELGLTGIMISDPIEKTPKNIKMLMAVNEQHAKVLDNSKNLKEEVKEKYGVEFQPGDIVTSNIETGEVTEMKRDGNTLTPLTP